ncbi:dTDP-4-dehydrorhamnose reductase [Sporosarcina globispora]|uniref:dTDP-4-dehydrorhamnose reductase n=2 Tax=Sporosarcina globispora TaxID=1459 RepID=A0A0M0GEX2_SPOGL|nr:dTDP-4-dehydrorhamnose reductase [Sporosarcina globispora]
MVKILITGAHGQLGKELVRKSHLSHSIVSLGKKELDITSQDQVENVILHFKPQYIIHTAAFTSAEQCEIQRKKAFEVNALGAGIVAKTAEKVDARLFYISTDYVFDGKKNSPYTVEDKPNPLSIYGMSKLLGERLVLLSKNASIIRTSWLFGHDGSNFVKTMLKLAKMGKEVKVVNDQIGCPTYVSDLAETILQLLEKKNGIYHVSNSGYCSWYTFAQTIFEEAGFDSKLVKPVTTKEYGAICPRPEYSIMENNSLVKQGIKPLRHWKEALNEFMRKELSQ